MLVLLENGGSTSRHSACLASNSDNSTWEWEECLDILFWVYNRKNIFFPQGILHFCSMLFLPVWVRSCHKSHRLLFFSYSHLRERSSYQIGWIFGKVPKGGGRISNPKIYIADFGNFKQGLLGMELIKRRVTSGFRVCFFNNCIDINWYYVAYASLHKCNHIHYKKFAI